MSLLAFFTPGPMEIAIIGIVAVLIFGNQLPKIARNLGSAIPSFKKGLSDVNDEVKGTISDAKSGVEDVSDSVKDLTKID